MKSSINYNILIAVSALLILGTLCIADVSAPFSLKVHGNTYYVFLKHLVSIFLGIAGGVIAFKIPLDYLKKNIEYITLGIIILMFLVFIPGIGVKAGGASRWIDLRFFTIQPSEFFKLAFIIFFAKKISSNRIRTLLDLIIMASTFLLISIPILIQKDMSTFMVLLAMFFAMYFLAQTPLKHAILMIIVAIIFAGIIIIIEPYRMHRIQLFLNPDLDPMGAGWQQKQSLISIGSGGLTGIGLGMSKQKMGFLPQPMTDSLFAIICEQLGFIGALGIIALYLFLLWSIFKMAGNLKNEFHKLICYGTGVWIIMQAFINIASAVGLFPVTGLPLPFMSMGGSSIIAGITAIGLLINISKQS